MSNLNVSSGHFVGNDGLPVNWEVDVTPSYEWPEQLSLREAIERARAIRFSIRSISG